LEAQELILTTRYRRRTGREKIKGTKNYQAHEANSGVRRRGGHCSRESRFFFWK